MGRPVNTKVGKATFVMSSKDEIPESDASIKSGADAGVGGVVSITILKVVADAIDKFPAKSLTLIKI